MANLNVLMSIGTILLLGYWLYHPGPARAWRVFKTNRPAIAMVVLYLLHVVWLFNSQDYAYASKDLRIKLPLLIFAVVLGSIHLKKKQWQYLFVALAAGVWAASIKAYINFWQAPEGFHEFRDFVTGVSHIRLSLIMVLTVAAIINFWRDMGMALRVAAVFTSFNIIAFFDLIQAASGVLILFAVLVFTTFYYARRQIGRRGLAVSAGVLVIFLGLAVFGLQRYYNHYFTSQESLGDLPTHSALGNPYAHYLEWGHVENGHYTFINIAEEEMLEAWEERSELNLRGEENYLHRAALMRYLSSKALRKDREGIMALSEQDVENIEMGYPSIVYAEKRGLDLRLHTVVFGYHQYKVMGSAGGSSFFQRLVYWKSAWQLVKRHFWLGTGTGDVKAAFENIYDETDVNLAPQYRLRAHNQYLTFWVTFGIVGFLTFVAMMFIPFLSGTPTYLYIAFLIIAFLSCISEDTLETQAGVTFFAFFYALFSNTLARRKPLDMAPKAADSAQT